MELSGFGALGTWRKRVARTPLTAEEALKHLLLSVDVDILYRCFIGCKLYMPDKHRSRMDSSQTAASWNSCHYYP